MFVEQNFGSRQIQFGLAGTRHRKRAAVGDHSFDLSIYPENFANENTVPLVAADTGILGSTRIRTMHGEITIDALETGHTILTARGTQERVAHVLKSRRTSSALRIRAPYFGASHDFVIGTNHHLKFRSEIAEYMFGVAEVFVPVWALKDNSKIVHHDLAKGAELFQVQLEGGNHLSVGTCDLAATLPPFANDKVRVLDSAEARAFASERRIGDYS